MNTTAQAPELHDLTVFIGVANCLFAMQYLTIAGLAALLWDHILTLPAEIEVIWRGKPDFSKIAFLFSRYLAEATIIYSAYVLCVLRHPLTDQNCKIYVLYVMASSIVAMAMANFTIAMRIQAIWNHCKHVTYTLIAGFLVTYGATAVFAGLVIRDLHVTYEPFVAKTCMISKKPPMLPGIWIGMIGFDLIVLTLVVLNAFNRPYRQNTDVISSLYKDGLTFFLVLLVIQLVSLVLSVVTGVAESFSVAFFIWAMISIMLSRLSLRIEAVKLGGRASHMWTGDMFELAEHD